MDGQRFRKWCLSGCLVFGAFGCNRNAVQSPATTMSTGQPVVGIPMATTKKSFWGGSSQTAAPVEVAAEPIIRKGPAKPETIAALATVQLDAAFDEKATTASRESLLDSARQGYQKALQQDPKCKPALLGLARYYVRVNERDKAVETYKKYLTIYPKDKDVAYQVALAYAQWKDWAGAVAWCEHALKLDPENLTYRKTMAFCLARAGKWEDGFAVFCQIMPEAQARYNMARVLEDLDQPDASRVQLQLAIKADPTYRPAHDLLTELDAPPSRGGVPDPNGVRQAGSTEPDPNQQP